jgi:hypothetical protein
MEPQYVLELMTFVSGEQWTGVGYYHEVGLRIGDSSV